jgi:hypothetical protein
MIHLAQQEANLLLGTPALGDILYRGDKMIDRPVVPTRGGAGDVDPDRRAVLAHEALFGFEAVGGFASQALVLRTAGLEIVGMSDVLHRLRGEFIKRITDDTGERLIDPEPFDIGAEMGDAPRNFRTSPATVLHGLWLRAGDKHGHDTACFVLDRHESNSSDAAPCCP